MRLFIPTIGTLLTLEEDWTFDLYNERRNVKFANQPGIRLNFPRWGVGQWLDVPGSTRQWVVPSTPVTLPKGTVLKVDRIYIRGKADEARGFDSVSFFCNPGTKKGTLKGRFWAKLDDVNQMDVQIGPPQLNLPLT